MLINLNGRHGALHLWTQKHLHFLVAKFLPWVFVFPPVRKQSTLTAGASILECISHYSWSQRQDTSFSVLRDTSSPRSGTGFSCLRTEMPAQPHWLDRIWEREAIHLWRAVLHKLANSFQLTACFILLWVCWHYKEKSLPFLSALPS